MYIYIYIYIYFFIYLFVYEAAGALRVAGGRGGARRRRVSDYVDTVICIDIIEIDMYLLCNQYMK